MITIAFGNFLSFLNLHFTDNKRVNDSNLFKKQQQLKKCLKKEMRIVQMLFVIN